MTTTRRKWLTRPAAGLAAVFALLLTTIGPAHAQNGMPDDAPVEGTFIGGFIDVNGTVFDIGGPPDPTCNPGGLESTLQADVGPWNSAGEAGITDIDAEFAPSEIPGTGICVTLEIDPPLAGGTIVHPNGPEVPSAEAFIDNPGITATVDIDIADCELTPIGPVDFEGEIVHDGNQFEWIMTLNADSFTVPEASGALCQALSAADMINDTLGLETDETEAELVIGLNEA